MVDNYKVGNRIALLRKETGMTGEKFAEALSVSPQAVSKWENGKCLPESTLLPEIAALLGTSIDAILMPKELVILDASFTCGRDSITVTDVLNRAMEGNHLQCKANGPFGDRNVEGTEPYILTVKYQSPNGTFFTFCPQGETLSINLDSKTYETTDKLQIIGAYYGTGKQYRPVLDKMNHYEFFKNNEMIVDHESFPSFPGVDETEYLTLVYLNSSGIHVVSCKENGTICFNEKHTEITVMDSSTLILQGVEPLIWGKDCTMPCTWAGALHAALTYMGETYTYEQLMGMSGACYRIAFCEVWDWSALDALVAYPYDMPLYDAIGYKADFACHLEKGERAEERRRIVSDIRSGKPILAINLRVAPEWGVITGFSDNGKTLYCRTYFDDSSESFEKGYAESENWPFIITHFGEQHKKPSNTDILIASLRTYVDSFYAPNRDGYFQGKQGYEKWIEGLQNDSLWSTKCPEGDIERRFDVHLSTVFQLVDARRCAAAYLTECSAFATTEQEKLKKIAENLTKLADTLHEFKEGLLINGVGSFVNNTDGKEKRKEQCSLLLEAMKLEIENVEIAKELI